MSIELFLYLLDICGSLSELLFFICLVSAIAFAGVLFYFFMSGFSYPEDKEDKNRFFKLLNYGKKRLWIVVLVVIFTILIPNKKTMYLIVGAHYLKTSEMPSKVEMAINKKLNEYLDYNEEERD